jgi:hypothetical protein
LEIDFAMGVLLVEREEKVSTRKGFPIEIAHVGEFGYITRRTSFPPR